MIKFKFLAYGITSILFLASCSKVLEPVSFFAGNQDIAAVAGQQEFEINIKSLNFDTAKKVNNAPYPRRLILTGFGSNAKISDEAIFLNSNFPKQSSLPDYHLNIGDEISFLMLNEFENEITQWPNTSKKSEYLLGPGDRLTFTQSNGSNQDISYAFRENGEMIPVKESNTLISTQGVIGNNGNILLFGLGNIIAANRTLEDVRAEVRNILIRNGLAPNFQLEISDFKSQVAFATADNGTSTVISLNNIPINLKEVALRFGVSASNENLAIIKLTRNNQKFRFTASQLFESSAPEIIIQDKDRIKIKIASNKSTIQNSIVGSKGNIILEGVGSLPALNRTLDDIYEGINNILIRKGIKPIFHHSLELNMLFY